MTLRRSLLVFCAVTLWFSGIGVSIAQDPELIPGPPHETNLVIGQAPPDFELTSIDGDSYRLSEQRGRRPVLLVFFRGTW